MTKRHKPSGISPQLFLLLDRPGNLDIQRIGPHDDRTGDLPGLRKITPGKCGARIAELGGEYGKIITQHLDVGARAFGRGGDIQQVGAGIDFRRRGH